MWWTTSASLLFAWFPFRAKTPVMMVKNILLFPPLPIMSRYMKYGSENIHACGALPLWVYFDSTFNTIPVIPPFLTQHVLTLHALCFADATREALWRCTCRQEQEKKVHLEWIKASVTEDLSTPSSDLWSWKDTRPGQVRELHCWSFYSMFCCKVCLYKE